MKIYNSQAARDAQKMHYGNEIYWQYLDDSAKEKAEYYKKHGDEKSAKEMFTRGLEEALKGNDGE